MAEEVKGFANLMRYCNTLEDYNQKKADGKVTDDVLVIVLEDKVIKFKGYTFNLSGEGFIPLSRDFSDDFNNDFAR